MWKLYDACTTLVRQTSQTIYWLAPLVRSVIQLCAVIFSNIGEEWLDATPQVGPFSVLVARPYSFLNVGLDFQATWPDHLLALMPRRAWENLSPIFFWRHSCRRGKDMQLKTMQFVGECSWLICKLPLSPENSSKRSVTKNKWCNRYLQLPWVIIWLYSLLQLWVCWQVILIMRFVQQRNWSVFINSVQQQ